jgi:hypothetical protein
LEIAVNPRKDLETDWTSKKDPLSMATPPLDEL